MPKHGRNRHQAVVGACTPFKVDDFPLKNDDFLLKHEDIYRNTCSMRIRSRSRSRCTPLFFIKMKILY